MLKHNGSMVRLAVRSVWSVLILGVVLSGFLSGCGKIENYRLKAHDDEVMSVSFSNSGRYLVTGSKDGTARIFDRESEWEMVCELTGHSSWVYQSVFMPDDKEIITAGFDGDLKLWSFGSCTELKTFSGHTDRVRAVSVHPSSQSFVSCGWDSTFISWDVEPATQLRCCQTPLKQYTCHHY